MSLLLLLLLLHFFFHSFFFFIPNLPGILDLALLGEIITLLDAETTSISGTHPVAY